jgi:hypothetical protein
VAKVLTEIEGIPIDDQYFLMKHHLDFSKNSVDFKENSSAITDDQAIEITTIR